MSEVPLYAGAPIATPYHVTALARTWSEAAAALLGSSEASLSGAPSSQRDAAAKRDAGIKPKMLDQQGSGDAEMQAPAPAAPAPPRPQILGMVAESAGGTALSGAPSSRAPSHKRKGTGAASPPHEGTAIAVPRHRGKGKKQDGVPSSQTGQTKDTRPLTISGSHKAAPIAVQDDVDDDDLPIAVLRRDAAAFVRLVPSSSS